MFLGDFFVLCSHKFSIKEKVMVQSDYNVTLTSMFLVMIHIYQNQLNRPYIFKTFDFYKQEINQIKKEVVQQLLKLYQCKLGKDSFYALFCMHKHLFCVLVDIHTESPFAFKFHTELLFLFCTLKKHATSHCALFYSP